MRIIDEHGRLLGRINVIDFLAALLVLSLVAGGIYKVTQLGQAPGGAVPKEVTLEVLIEGVRQPTVDAISVGDAVREYNSGEPFGVITAKRVEAATEVVPTADGRLVLATVPGKYNINLTIRCDAMVSDRAITIGRTEVRIGSMIRVKTVKYAVMFTVMGIEVTP